MNSCSLTMYRMHSIVTVFIIILFGGVISRIQNWQQSYVTSRNILSKFSHRRNYPRESNIGDQQTVLEFADLSSNIPNPCDNGGTLLHDVKRNKYICQCLNEYEGRHCEIKSGACFEDYNACRLYENSSVTHKCRAVQGNGFVCYYYPPQYRSNWCHVESMKNHRSICPENWTCIDHILGQNQGYRCLPPGQINPPIIREKRQAEMIEKCNCHNGGHCNQDKKCICLLHFTGLYCESHINYCKSNPCPPDVSCEPVLGGYNCNCPALRGGHNCELTKIFNTPTMVSPHFNYNPNQYASVSSTYLFYVKEIGVLPKLLIDFGDGTTITMFREDFYLTDKLNDILISFLYQPIDKTEVVYLINYTHAYSTEGLYHISLIAWNEQYITMKSNYTVLVSSPESCEFSVDLINAATTPDNATIYQRRHSINIHSVSTVTCPGTRLKYLWDLFAVPNIFTAYTPEMSRRLAPDVLIRISEFYIPPYSLPFGDYVLRLTVEMQELTHGGTKSVITWFKVVKDKIVAHISGGNIRQVHKLKSTQLDASESYDPNFPSNTMQFEWKCSTIQFGNVVSGFCDNEFELISDQPVLNIPRNVLKLNGIYTFTVNVESIEHDRAEQSVQVQVVSEDTELVYIECVQNCLGNQVITTSPMALRAISSNYHNNMDYIWTLTNNNDQSVSANMEIEYYSDGSNFVTKAGMLLPAQKYQVSVRVQNKNDSIKKMGRAVIDLVTYPALMVGFCIIRPLQGYALLTVFKMNCFHFIAHYLPVIYEVFQYRLPKEEPIMVGFGVTPEFHNMTLAAGLPENDYSTALRIYASDSKGNFGFYEQDITVFPAAMYTNLDDELALVKKLTLGTASTIVMDLANQEVGSVIKAILSASSSVHTLSQQLGDIIGYRKSASLAEDPILQEKIDTIVQFKDTMVEYLSLCELRSPAIAKYCSSTLTFILECDYHEDILTNRRIIPYANRKAVNVLDNVVGLLHKITQQSEDVTVIRTDILDIGTTILSSISLLLKKPKGRDVSTLLSRRLNMWQTPKSLKTNEIPHELEIQLSRQTEAVINSMNDYASLFTRYMAPHEDDYLTNPTEDICISVQKTNRGFKTATLPAYVEVNVSIISNDSNAMYDLQVIALKNNPYWWGKNAEDINFPLVMVDVFNTVKELRSRIARVGASRKHEIGKPWNPVTYKADLQFTIPEASNPINHQRIQGAVALKPTWNYSDSDIAVHKLEFHASGKMILVFDNQEDNVLLRVVVKKNARPNLNDFWEPEVIPKFEETNLTERQKYSIYFESENSTEESVFFYVGVLPHQVSIRSFLNDVDPPVPDVFLYKNLPPKPEKTKVKDYITYSFKAYSAQCLRWHSLKRKWSNHCKILENTLTETTISCRCDGLSTIGASFRAANVEKSPLSSFSMFIKLLDNSLIFWFLIYLMVFSLGLFAWGGMRDRHDKIHDRLIFLNDNNEADIYRYIILVQTGRNLDSTTSARVAVMLEGSQANSSVHVLHSIKRRVMLGGSKDYFVLCTPRSLGDVFCLHIWHNHKSMKPIWYIKKIIVHDVQTHYVSFFIFETWLTPLHEDGHMGLTCYRMLNNEILPWQMRLKSVIIDIIRTGCHSWIGMCVRHLTRNNTRRRHIVLMFVHASVLMAFVTEFYPLPEYYAAAKQLDLSEEFTFAWEEVIVGILAAGMAFPVNFLLFCLAKNVAPVQSYATDYSSKYTEELVIPMPANSEIAASKLLPDKKISPTEEMLVNSLYKPGQKQVIGKRTIPLRIPQGPHERIFYDEVISRMGPIQAAQRIRLAYFFSHTFLYPFWAVIGVVLLVALYFVLFYATFYTWATGLRYLFATIIGFIFSFLILEPMKVMVYALWKMRRLREIFIIDDRSRIALYVARDLDDIQMEKYRIATIYKPPPRPPLNISPPEEKQKNL